jgi:peptidoglycan hydrolase-like protein with peptidoglycan-binding domain
MTVDSSSTARRIGPGASTDPKHVDAEVAVVPALTGARVGGHPDFDRVVLDLDGELPGFDVRYVPEVTRDGSGEPVVLRGRAFLAVSVFPSSTFGDEGPPGLPLPPITGFAALRDLAFAGDFEAVVSFGIGIAEQTSFLVQRLASPSRIVIDIAHVPPGRGDQLLRRGDRSAAVATWQWRLRLALARDLTVDEDFGPLTEAATRDFQRAEALAVDGVVGPRSRTAMERALGL